jgi:hypothetical protein
MKKYSKNIQGYDIQLEIDPKCDPSTDCWVEKEGHTASLTALSHEGVLRNSSDYELKVPDSIIHRIEDWAYANGY